MRVLSSKFNKVNFLRFTFTKSSKKSALSKIKTKFFYKALRKVQLRQ